MKQNILIIAVIVVLVFAGCGEKETNESEEKINNDITNEVISDAEEDSDEINNTEELLEESDETEEQQNQVITIYYLEENSENIVSKKITVSGDVSKAIIQELKGEAVLSKECEIQKITIDQTYRQIHIDINQAFGEYFRSMGITGSELILKCLVLSYQDAYDCEGILITENGKVFDTGHADLDGYISYK